MNDLVERLRWRAARLDHVGDGMEYYHKGDAATDREAADEIEHLRREQKTISELREAYNELGITKAEIKCLRTAMRLAINMMGDTTSARQHLEQALEGMS
jgi:hypothetical protein